jgi:hypothetical protein
MFLFVAFSSGGRLFTALAHSAATSKGTAPLTEWWGAHFRGSCRGCVSRWFLNTTPFCEIHSLWKAKR